MEDFWQTIWGYFEVDASGSYSRVLEGREVPEVRWFHGSRINYARHIFRKVGTNWNKPALNFQSEQQEMIEITWRELYQPAAATAQMLKGIGVQTGDRVVSYMPNIPQSIIAFLTFASMGAVWSSCSPDFGTPSVIDRFFCSTANSSNLACYKES